MEVRLAWVEGWAVEVSEALTTAIQREKKMQQKLMDLESRSRRNNILIFGVPEGEERSSAIRFVLELLKRELPITADENLKIQWATAPLPLNQDPRPLHAPLLATFRSLQLQNW